MSADLLETGVRQAVRLTAMAAQRPVAGDPYELVREVGDNGTERETILALAALASHLLREVARLRCLTVDEILAEKFEAMLPPINDEGTADDAL